MVFVPNYLQSAYLCLKVTIRRYHYVRTTCLFVILKSLRLLSHESNACNPMTRDHVHALGCQHGC